MKYSLERYHKIEIYNQNNTLADELFLYTVVVYTMKTMKQENKMKKEKKDIPPAINIEMIDKNNNHNDMTKKTAKKNNTNTDNNNNTNNTTKKKTIKR